MGDTDLLGLLTSGWRALVRYRVRAALVFAVVVGTAVGGALLLPREYASSAKLMVKIGRESVTLDPTATVGQTLSVYDSRETEVNTILEIMGSRAVLADVVAELGPADVLGEPGSESRGETTDDLAIKELQDTTSVERGRKSNVITVAARSNGPERAQRIVEAMLDSFRGRYLVANRTAGSYEFFVGQERIVANDLAEATDALNAARNELSLGTVEGERRKIETHVAAVETQRTANATALAAAESRVAALERQIGELPRRMVAQEVTGFAEDAGGQTLRQLYALKLREHELLVDFRGTHPDVQAVRERIARAEAILAGENARNTQTTTSENPAHAQASLALLTERSNVESLRGRARALDRQYDEAIARMRQLNMAESRLVELKQRVDRLRADHRDYAQKLEQARIDQALADERISNVNVWQKPTLEPRPIASKRRVIAVLGAFVGLLAGVGVAIGSDYLDRRTRTAENAPLRHELATAMAT